MHNIDPNKPITKWEAQQQIDKRNKPSTPSQYRESPAREKRWIQVDELQSSQREAQSENTMKANDEKNECYGYSKKSMAKQYVKTSGCKKRLQPSCLKKSIRIGNFWELYYF
ncbi:hypothetical protein GCM10020331_011950 [Ectobacillus funiculus]